MKSRATKIDVTSGGVYVIVCASTKRRYIGTAAVLLLRIASHIHLLNGGSHQNRELQEDWLIYGSEAFTFHIAKKTNDKSERCALEQTMIRKARKRRIQPYNVLRQPSSYNQSPSTSTPSKEPR